MAKLKFEEGEAVRVVHTEAGVFGVREMPAIYRGRWTHIDDDGYPFTYLYAEAVWPHNFKPRNMTFAADDRLQIGPFREWRLEALK